MVFNATSNNISAISWWSVLLMEKTINLSQVTDKLYHVMPERDSNFSGEYNKIYFHTSVFASVD
jgi:hypothetical protein